MHASSTKSYSTEITALRQKVHSYEVSKLPEHNRVFENANCVNKIDGTTGRWPGTHNMET